MNARYQKNQEPAGKTRKSAASVKPKRTNPDAPKKAAKPRSALGRAAAQSRSAAGPRPAMAKITNPEYKKLRKRWWWLLGAGLVLVTGSYLVQAYTKFQYSSIVSTVMLTLSYAAIFYALYLDWAKMRPMREAARSGASAKHAKPAKTKDSAKDAETDKKKTASK